MLIPVYLRQFEKEVIKAKKRGKPIEKLKKIMKTLSQEKPILLRHRNHKLKGEYIGYWECHIEPDWLLIYKKNKTHLIFVRTGTHSDLF